MTANNKSKLAGFTLIELLIVVAIIAILASLAYSSYSQYVIRSKRAEAFAALEQMAGVMEKNFTINSVYVSTGAINNFIDVPTTIFSQTVPLDGGDPYYNLQVRSPTVTQFEIRAVPTGSQAAANEGIIWMNNQGLKRWDENADGDFDDAGEENWKKD